MNSEDEVTALGLLIGPRLLKGGTEVKTSTLRGIVGVYFSAHWCGPCRSFTPQFRKVYERAKSKGRAFEVVFMSSDHDEQSFKEYFATMPWHAIPYEQRARYQHLNALFQIRGIPALVLLDAHTGGVLDTNARSRVMAPNFVSTLPRSIDLDAACLPEVGSGIPILVRYRGKEFELECEPSEGWEMLRMQIYSMTEVPSEQMKLFGLGLDTGLLDDSIPLPRALARGLFAQKGSGLRSAGVPGNARKASSLHSDESLGYTSGAIDSTRAWCSKKDDETPWYQMDLGEVNEIAGVIVASRADAPQWITRFKVSLADSEDGPWKLADDGREFVGPTFLCPCRAVFHSSNQARFVRVEPLSFHNHCSLRADVLLASDADRDKLPTIVVLGNFSAGDVFEFSSPETKSDAMMEQQHLAMLQAKLSRLPPKLHNQASSLQNVLRYESRQLQHQALNEIPVCSIDTCTSSESYELSFMKQLVRWYKHGFFSWTNAPRCDHCHSTNTKIIGGAKPTPEEEYFLAHQVEVAQCSSCGQQTRFPRYNDPAKLLETRTGRCGEWANCFTLICRSLGYEARHVHDWTDHVWTEIFSDSAQRWIHVDSCEAAVDSPLMYETGWGKKLTYCIGFARDHVVDVTRRYTKKFEKELLPRRTACKEEELKHALSALDEFALERSLVQYTAQQIAMRRKHMEHRASEEKAQFEVGSVKALKPEEEVGRTSGDAAWREQRGELGATEAAKQKALECSEKGLDSVAKTEPSGDAGYTSEDAQAMIRARVAKLMADGLTANDALLKVLADAKKK